MRALPEKPIMVNCYFLPSQLKALNKLSDRTRINRQVFVREAVDDLLKKYRKVLRKGGKK